MVERGEHKTGRIRGKIEQLVANFQQPIIVFEPSRPSYTRLSIIYIYIYTHTSCQFDPLLFSNYDYHRKRADGAIYTGIWKITISLARPVARISSLAFISIVASNEILIQSEYSCNFLLSFLSFSFSRRV